MTTNAGHERCFCHFMPDLIAVGLRTFGSDDEREEAMSRAVEVTGGTRITNGEACRVLDRLDHSTVERVLQNVGLIEIGNGDPHVLSNALTEDKIPSSAVHGVGFLGHGGYQGSILSVPGDPIEDVTDASGSIIAVVDSGLAPAEDLPHWMQRSDVVVDRPVDTEYLTLRDSVSHGTFVTSRLRILNHEHQISLASARPDPGFLTSDEPNHSEKAAPRPTDELNVLAAVIRLMERHTQKDDVRALNMSLGVHDCPQSATQMVTLRAAVELWSERFEDRAPIVAAAGNSTCPEPLYPAAWSGDRSLHIRAIAAECEGEHGLTEVVWDRNGNPEDAPHRDWVTDKAPGCDVNGLTGAGPDQTAHWGGSSFAATVVSSNL